MEVEEIRVDQSRSFVGARLCHFPDFRICRLSMFEHFGFEWGVVRGVSVSQEGGGRIVGIMIDHQTLFKLPEILYSPP